MGYFYKFSRREIMDLLKAWLALALAFAILYSFDLSQVSIFAGGLPSFSLTKLLVFFSISLFTVGTGFLLHELAHKIVAQRYGARAEFKSFDGMLLLALFMSLFGFILAAPGAVVIYGRLSNRENGKVSIAGPLVNILLAVFFLILLLIMGNNLFLSFGFSINSWLALFNMIPAMPFDGKKVYAWNKAAYFFALASSIALVIASFL